LFHPEEDRERSKILMDVLDKINRQGRGHLFFAAQGVTPQWSMKREFLSPAYTTNWNSLPKVY